MTCWLRRTLTATIITILLATPAAARSIQPFYTGWTEHDWFLFHLYTDPEYRLRWTAWVIGSYPGGQCGGDLPPCYVMRRESGGSLTAQNPTSSASGKWQFLRSSWERASRAEVVVQFPEAWLAPEFYQDEAARRLWDRGAGCGHWSAC